MVRTVWSLALVLPMALASGLPARAGDDDAPAYSMADVTACSKDALRLCRDKLSDIGAIEGCMKEKFAELSPKCQTRFKGH